MRGLEVDVQMFLECAYGRAASIANEVRLNWK